jgi:succinate dehydrogenase / fumarate reductase membrane anchor subunit
VSLRSPLGHALGHGSARTGAAHWYQQRVTAIALLLLGTWFAVSLACLGGASYGLVRAWLAAPRNSVLTVLLVLVAAWHAALGLQVVVEDYVSAKLLRATILIVVNFALAVAAVTGVLAVLRVAFGVVA